MTQPWSNQGIALIVIEAGTGNFAGLFLYSPNYGHGNLVASIAPGDGSDPVSDPYFDVFTCYTGNTPTDQFTSFRQNGMFYGLNQNGPAGTGHVIFHPQGGIYTEAVTAFDPTAGYPTVETWHPATLVNGWTGTLDYRMTAGGDLQISADLTAGTTTNGTTIFTFPAPYRPALKRRIPAAFDGSVASGGNPYFILNTDGTFTVHWVTSSQTLGGFEAVVRLA